MTDIFTYITKDIFKIRSWDPNTIPNLGNWEPAYRDETVPISKVENWRGQQTSSLSLAERLKNLETELRALEEALPDRNNI